MVAIAKLNHGCLQESQKKVLKIDISVTPKLIGDYQFKKVEFKGICSKQNSMYFLHKNVVNLYISYELDTWSRDLKTDFTLANWLFGVVKLSKNADWDKYGYSGYSIGFNSHSIFLW